MDCEREAVPISGTEARGAAFENRAFIHPIVYRDLVTTVVFLGAPSTGKTTIAKRMAEEYETIWMAEYGREYWEQHNIQRIYIRRYECYYNLYVRVRLSWSCSS